MPRLMLTDIRWKMLLHLMKSTDRIYNKPEHRKTFEGILYRLRTGIPWRDLPREFGSWSTIFRRFNLWSKKRCFVILFNWLAKCSLTHQRYGSEILALVPVATNTSHWKQSVFGQALAVCFLYDTRLKFLENGSSAGKGAPMSCAMIYWGKNYDKFYEVFIVHGAVVNLSNLQGEQIGPMRKQPRLPFG